MRTRTLALGALLVAALLAAPVVVSGAQYSNWSTPLKLDTVSGNSSDLNTTFLDGCPIQSPDGLALYMASNRPNGVGGIDIWVARRTSITAPWDAPVNLGRPVNSEADDFCPTPVRGKGLYFVSRRTVAGACGGSDLFFTRDHPVRGWTDPVHFDCTTAGGPNGPLDEQGPSYVEYGGQARLYYSAGPEIVVSLRAQDGSFGPPSPVAELNGPASDIQPNIRKDGLEIVFTSNDPSRPGSHGTSFDLYVATRADVGAPFSTPVNLGEPINTVANETRPSLSWDATGLLFGRTPGPEGSTDIFVATRDR